MRMLSVALYRYFGTGHALYDNPTAGRRARTLVSPILTVPYWFYTVS